jgi:catechol 2,3-dioxygenase-like lactoylglutathione lyase family enzyme
MKLIQIHPKLPMRNKTVTKDFYIGQLGFQELGSDDFAEYLMVKKDAIEIHFFAYPDLDPLTNDGQVYIRVSEIDELYQAWLNSQVPIHPNGKLSMKTWGQKEFAILDPDHNLLTFGETI